MYGIYLPPLLDSYGKLVGKYTVRPMDPMGNPLGVINSTTTGGSTSQNSIDPLVASIVKSQTLKAAEEFKRLQVIS